MRATLIPLTRPEEAFTLVDGEDPVLHHASWPEVALYLGEDPLEGWEGIGGVSPRVDETEFSEGDGSYMATELQTGTRATTLRGIAKAEKCRRESSVGLGLFEDHLASLLGEPIRLEVDDHRGWRWSEGFVASAPTWTRLGRSSFEFAHVLSFPDPLKYGRTTTYTATGSASSQTVTVDNPGTGQVWPVISLPGRVTWFDVTFGDRRIRWEGAGLGVTTGIRLDLRSLLPVDGTGRQVGTLIFSDTFRLPRGSSTIQIGSNVTGATVEVTPGWR